LSTGKEKETMPSVTINVSCVATDPNNAVVPNLVLDCVIQLQAGGGTPIDMGNQTTDSSGTAKWSSVQTLAGGTYVAVITTASGQSYIGTTTSNPFTIASNITLAATVTLTYSS
jgi:hypothetical protein